MKVSLWGLGTQTKPWMNKSCHKSIQNAASKSLNVQETFFAPSFGVQRKLPKDSSYH